MREGPKEPELIRFVGPVDGGESREIALSKAEARAAKFQRHDFEEDAKYPYYWGRDDDVREVHHFEVRPMA
jgi:hypothetical protein